jgi:hypothetical protein
MKKLLIVSAVLLCSVSLFGQKTRYGQGLPSVKSGVDYPSIVHVYSTRVRSYCQPQSLKPSWEQCMDVIYADVIAEGKKFELKTDSGINQDPFHPLVLPLGDYHARSTKVASGTDPIQIGNTYDLVLPDNKVLRCSITGLSE